MSQENKKSKAPVIKDILNKYGLKGRLSVRNHSCLVLTISEGMVDFVKSFNETCKTRSQVADGHIQVNEFHFSDHFSWGEARIIRELYEAMNVGNHDNSDPQTDYFDVGWYTNINIGEWDNPYIFK